ncbi:glycosyltransferase family protein [Leptodesmis sp.]|uniref:glycosyltransferase family protein n=1 Tax=Leptodesmis sp. TaxID=3100501 RepID=UPI0040535759
MRIALHNPYFGKLVAETELARRISLAATNLGWEAKEVASSIEINQFAPDLVICLHFRVPKLTKYPTYGCFWDPPAFFESDPQFIKNILSYDGYLCGSNLLEQWLKDTYYHLPKHIEILPFYPSCNATSYVIADFEHPRLAYIGSNWDGARFQELFLALEQTGYLDTYGNPEGWAYLKTAYRQAIPFDGVSLLNVLRQSGVGLCLHRDEHCQAQVPSMRIFEIVASGAIAICAEHPFIREYFGDRVLYLKPNQSIAATVQQISAHLQWIQAHPAAARDLSVAAHKYFSEHFTLEKLLANLLPHHQTLVEKQQFLAKPQIHLSQGRSDSPMVQLIVRTSDRNLPTMRRTLDSLAQQTYRNIGAIVVQYQASEGLDEILATYRDRLQIQHIHTHNFHCRSTHLWAGLHAISSKYFGILDDGDVIHPNHITSLVTLLEEFDNFGVAYSGAIRIWVPEKQLDQAEAVASEFPSEPAFLAHFDLVDEFEFLQLKNPIASNSFLARASLLDRFLKKDPQLNALEDLFLLLNLFQRTNFIFSYQATSEFYQSFSKPKNLLSYSESHSSEARQRIMRIMQHQSFSRHQTLGKAQIEAMNRANMLDRIQEIETRYVDRIQAMESSKFWQLRRMWFRVKQAIGLSDKGSVP